MSRILRRNGTVETNKADILAAEEKKLLVVSAVPLLPKQKKDIERLIQMKYGENLNLRNIIDDSIIAGIYLTVGDKVIDVTLRTKIEKLREKLFS